MFEILNAFFDATLGPVLGLKAPFGLMIVSLLLTTLVTLATKFFTDQHLMKSLKDEMKEMQNKLKDTTQTVEQKMGLQKDILEKNMKYMKHSFKPMLITFLPIIIIFSWLRGYYIALGDPKVLLGLSWLWSYLIFSIVFSMLLRKLLKIH